MKNNDFSFELITQNDNARLGIISTPKGKIDTPAFMHSNFILILEI